MKRFEHDNLPAALAQAANGGQALCVFAPLPHVRIGFIFDPDSERLARCASALGCRAATIRNPDSPLQYVEVGGRALARAEQYCQRDVATGRLLTA